MKRQTPTEEKQLLSACTWQGKIAFTLATMGPITIKGSKLVKIQYSRVSCGMEDKKFENAGSMPPSQFITACCEAFLSLGPGAPP